MRIHIFRHGSTAWSVSGQHTGLTDIDLTEAGKQEARKLGESLKGQKFDHVLSSPLKRAKETCALAGLSAEMQLEDALLEWDYGDYEGKTSEEIAKTDPDWTIFTKDPPHGETSLEIQKRVDFLIQRLKRLGGEIALFSSGHISRSIAARWLGLPVSFGMHFYLSTSSKSILGYDHNQPIILLWNDTSHLNRSE
jgi:broad specificity phosphatase PhoE